MTVKELREALAKYPDDYEVNLIGGESGCGDWAALEVGTYVKRPYVDYLGVASYAMEFKAEDTIMEY